MRVSVTNYLETVIVKQNRVSGATKSPGNQFPGAHILYFRVQKYHL